MVQLYRQEAFDFYQKFILHQAIEKAEIYKQYGFTLQGSVSSKDWEVFAAILLDDRAKPGDGADLIHYEVKSAIIGSGFEYQYHKNFGEQKLLADMAIEHVFIMRSRDFLQVDVWLLERSRIKSLFKKWQPALIENYLSGVRQRFRRSVPYKFVLENGRKIVTIVDGKLID
ncbi:MAG: hypothetical protein AAF614_30780 [Chloroflexota bacterium]